MAASAKHAEHGGVGAQNGAAGVEGEHAGGNIFEDGFHQLATTFEFLNGLLEIAGELIDLRAAVAELAGHGVEGANQDAEFVLRLLRDLILEIAGGNLTRAFSERLNGYGDLFGEKERDPSDGEEQQHGEEEENQEHLALEGAQILFFRVVFVSLRLDFCMRAKKRGWCGRP